MTGAKVEGKQVAREKVIGMHRAFELLLEIIDKLGDDVAQILEDMSRGAVKQMMLTGAGGGNVTYMDGLLRE